MESAVRVEDAKAGGSGVLLGRPSSTRAEWEAARETDACDLNRLLEAGGEVQAYIVPLWSNAEVERCLAELRGFDDARVYVVPAPGEGRDAVFAAIAESEWAGAAHIEGGEGQTAQFLYDCAGLDIPVYVEGTDPTRVLKALALALGEDLSPKEIEGVLSGESRLEPDEESLDHAREMSRG
jgi:hypothetical protein